jgi:hypothetical protein
MVAVTQEQLGLELGSLEARLRTDMEEMRGDLRAEMAGLRGDLRREMAELRGDLRGEMAALRGEVTVSLERELRAQTWRLCGAVLVAFGIFGTLVGVV